MVRLFYKQGPLYARILHENDFQFFYIQISTIYRWIRFRQQFRSGDF
jgi:hypothetical protein